MGLLTNMFLKKIKNKSQFNNKWLKQKNDIESCFILVSFFVLIHIKFK